MAWMDSGVQSEHAGADERLLCLAEWCGGGCLDVWRRACGRRDRPGEQTLWPDVYRHRKWFVRCNHPIHEQHGLWGLARSIGSYERCDDGAGFVYTVEPGAFE